MSMLLGNCQNAEKPADVTTEEPATEVAPATKADNQLIINDDSVLNLKPGMLISDADKLQKEVMQTGEGDFDIYPLTDENGNRLGYILPDPRDEKKIGSIHITSDKLTTPAGIRVGDSFSKLEKVMGEVVVHGSEIEGRTMAQFGNMVFRLDTQNYTYEVDKSKIKPATKILEISI